MVIPSSLRVVEAFRASFVWLEGFELGGVNRRLPDGAEGDGVKIMTLPTEEATANVGLLSLPTSWGLRCRLASFSLGLGTIERHASSKGRGSITGMLFECVLPVGRLRWWRLIGLGPPRLGRRGVRILTPKG
jgi:hypothetical protein